MTANKASKEGETPGREAEEGAWKEAVAPGTGVGGWLAFGLWDLVEGPAPWAGRDQQKETLPAQTSLQRAVFRDTQW